ncbi:MAG: type I pullulanase [Oscillospiraceae bacterium]|nr:type I pullulanase [Oscillospiraceae bacterium]
MTRRKPLAMFLALIMLLTLLSGCGGGSAPKPDTPPEPDPPQGEEFVLPREDGCNQLTLYWNAPDVDYTKCDVWIWWDGKDGNGELFHPCDYGVKCVVNVPESVTEVGFIVRRSCSDPGGSSWGDATKDYEDDRYAVITGPDTVIYLKTGDGAQYISEDGGTTLSQIRLFTLAGIMSPNEIRYHISPAKRIESLDQIKVRDGDRELEIASLSSLNNEVVVGTITLAEDLDLSRSYTVEIEGYGTQPALPTGLFDSPSFIEQYVYDGDDLGATVRLGETCFQVWAPTASAVQLNLFEAGNDCDAYASVPMLRGDKGVWYTTAPCGHGTYYTYTVTTAVGTQEAVDPYARAVGVNGDRGMVVDLSKTDPDGFDSDRFYQGLSSYRDASIWEVHVRDFSNTIADSHYPGKYLAFTETGLTNESGLPVGVDYVKDLGVTHVHLQPVYDYATVDESSDTPQFNWGYDPKNYNVPEGSYSTDPYHGEVRINEFKQMVQSLHANGLGVIMDVVYNHTYDLNSNLNRIVPYYYYRFNAAGAASNGSGCGNETASNRAMFRKYMVDSVCYWASEYHVDGFRFDLMALHDVETMQAIESALHAINPKAILYGEGWTGGTTPLNDNQQANQKNIAQITATGNGIGAVAVFNDVIRDGLKGSVFDAKGTGYVNGSPSKGNADKVIFGLQGGLRTIAASWGVNDAMVINYTSSHDNQTLWDKLAISAPDADVSTRLAMNRLSAAAVILSRGTPFMLAGEEMLRTKGGDANSYKSSDEVNNLDWAVLTPDSDQWAMSRFYRTLLQLRRDNDFLRNAEITGEVLDHNAILATYTVGGEAVAVAVFNGDAQNTLTLADYAGWEILLRGDGTSGGAADGSLTVGPIDFILLHK